MMDTWTSDDRYGPGDGTWINLLEECRDRF